jgi:hypothetical protein
VTLTHQNGKGNTQLTRAKVAPLFLAFPRYFSNLQYREHPLFVSDIPWPFGATTTSLILECGTCLLIQLHSCGQCIPACWHLPNSHNCRPVVFAHYSANVYSIGRLTEEITTMSGERLVLTIRLCLVFIVVNLFNH